jgi:RES domain-containing protein
MRHSATRFRGGGRFNGEALGAWYCATDIETAIAGTVYHQTMSLAHSAGEFCHQT